MSQHPAVAYLRNAHDQAARWATAASDPQGWWLINPRYADHRTVREYVIEGERGPVVHVDVEEHDPEAHAAEAQLIQTNSPRAVLSRIAADREVLVEHAESWGHCAVCSGEDYDGADLAFRRSLDWPCPTILAVARGWGWAEEAADV